MADLCAGNGFPMQRASNAESVAISGHNHFLNESFLYLIQISLKCVPPFPNNSSMVQKMAQHRTGNMPFPEPMMILLLVFGAVDEPHASYMVVHF